MIARRQIAGRTGSGIGGGLPAAILMLAAGLLILLLGGCEFRPAEPADTTPPVAAPSPPPAARPAPSAASRAIADHFTRLQAEMLHQGLMRTDGGGPDTPFGPRELTENFVRIALYDEYINRGGRLIAEETPARLRRWQGPVRIGLRFGAGVDAARRARDTALVTDYAARLARLTGLNIRVGGPGVNYWVYVVSEDERPGLGPEWAALFPGLAPHDLNGVTGMGLETYCMVLAVADGNSPVYSGALAVIRAELPDLLRLSCYHEEIAQGLGLANDYARARPSIFNDDEEFATLTRHDELLLRILYDPRLRPGMREAEVRPLLGPIVDIMAGGEG